MAALRLVMLTDGIAEATVAPDLGGGLASYDLIGAVGRAALFRPCRDLSRAGPFDLANNLLVPWSNRDFRRRLQFPWAISSARTELGRRALSDSRQRLFERVGG
jgi:hypothetical protein